MSVSEQQNAEEVELKLWLFDREHSLSLGVGDRTLTHASEAAAHPSAEHELPGTRTASRFADWPSTSRSAWGKGEVSKGTTAQAPLVVRFLGITLKSPLDQR